ncbi:MAG: hypothetical protein RJB38_1968 [Pseudomonadota bacterium]|jgi:4-hydroxythreonine-4-phosphate dehydrogenase
MVIALTPGDPEGIGPEIVLKTLLNRTFMRTLPRHLRLVVVGSPTPFERLGAPIEIMNESDLGDIPQDQKKVRILAPPQPIPRRSKRFSIPGYVSGWAIEKATKLALQGSVAALVTGPISKERLQAGGYPFPGHTEMLAALCRRKAVTMMLANEQLRISLVTTHLPLNKVSRAITPQEITRAVEHTAEALLNNWRISRPKIAVAALNPHAGEGGLFGTEETRIIQPTIQRLRRSNPGILLEGPLPADTLFAKNAAARMPERYDAVICMYHDQGLIPVKLLDFPRTVNVTLGLPIIRTSVDHGVAFDIAGKGSADPSSFQSALRMACAMVEGRQENRR